MRRPRRRWWRGGTNATGGLAAGTLVMAALASVTFLCALAFPDRREELQPELWGVAVAAAE